MKQGEGEESESDIKNTMLTHLGSFFVSDTKRTMNNLKHEVHGFETNIVHFSDNDNLYI